MLATLLTLVAACASAQPRPYSPFSQQPSSPFSQPPTTASTAPVYGLAPGATGQALLPGTTYGALLPGTTNRALLAGTTAQPRPEGPANLSGMVLMPTAYRGTNRDNSVGMGLDINAAYYIGRIYGKNNYPWTLEKTNYIDRIGQRLLTADGKMEIQSEGEYRPAVAVGAMGMFGFRDSPQPSIGQASGTTVTANVSTSQQMGAAYLVATKRFYKHFIGTLGYTEGDTSEIFGMLSEFLAPNALTLDGDAGRTAETDGMLFGGLLIQPKSTSVYGIEVIKPQGMVLNPTLINLNLGSLLHLNFQVSLLTFHGGYDILGMIQFRYSQYPK
jgi:hypothetical protein